VAGSTTFTTILVYRFEGTDLEDLLEDPDFHTYLARKSRDIAGGTTKSQQLKVRR
jgi:hypothetical protein